MWTQGPAKLSNSASPFIPVNSFAGRTDGCTIARKFECFKASIASRRSVKISPFSFSLPEEFTLGSVAKNGLQTPGKHVESWRTKLSVGECSSLLLESNSDADTLSLESSILAGRSNEDATSPKEELGSKWRQYMGSNNWEGLLDPLDRNLRREIIKYGEFVNATYKAVDFDPQSKTYGQCKYSKCSLLNRVGLRGSGYRVTQHLYATSDIEIPRWLINKLSTYSRVDATWMERQTSWIGFVAVCEDENEVARLGRREIVVAYRGTVTSLEWLENLKSSLTSLPGTWLNSTSQVDAAEPKVESGFWSLYTSQDRLGRSVSTQVMKEIRRLVNLYRGEEVSVTVTGHSLGAALTLLTAYQLGSTIGARGLPVTAISFGGPRVGNRAFGCRVEETGTKVLRIVNTQDVVTKIPGVVLNESWMNAMKRSCSDNVKKLVRVLESLPWAYWHVGTELRVNSKNSPYLKPDADMSCCHDLEAYLHLIDGFSSSSIPFRSTAKRDILRLAVNQKSNVLLKAVKSKTKGSGNNKCLGEMGSVGA